VTKGTGLTLIALGAILAFAVNGHPSFLNIQVIGWIVMATGLAGILVPRSGYATLRRRIVRKRFGPDGPVTEVDERKYPPYFRLNPATLSPEEADTADLPAPADQPGDEGDRVETVDYYLDT
jgi:hypothetical protein